MYLLAKTLRVLLAASIALAPISAQAQQNLPYFRYGVYGSTGGSTTPNPDPTNGLLVHVTPDTANAFIGQPVSFIAGVTYVNPPALTSPPPANRTMLRSAPVITYELIAVQGSIAALGLTFSDNVVSGTLTSNGAASFQIKATDSAGLTGISPVVTVSATPPRIGYGEQIDIVEGYPFVIEGPATNLPTPTFSMAGGVPGATIDNATGTIRGSVPDVETPTLFTFDVVASSGPVTQNSQAKVMALPATSTLTITQGTVLAGAIISGFTTTNLPSPTWTLVAAPPGVAIDPSTGVISGRVDADVGAYVFTARATAPNGATSVTNTVTIEVSPPILAVDVTPGVLKVLKGQPVEITSTSNEIGVVTFSMVPLTGSIESLGLSFDNGRISGTATEAGTATFRIRAVNDAGAFGLSRIVSLTIDERAIAYQTPGSVLEGSFYRFMPPQTNIPTPTFELVNGPVGAVLNPTSGAIEGFVGDILTDQVLTFEVRASNGTLSAVTTTSLVARAASANVSFVKNPVMASGPISGTATTTMAPGASWSLVNAPNGLVINPVTGAISGSVAAVGSYTFSAVVTAASGARATSEPATLIVEPLVLDVQTSAGSATVFVGQPIDIRFTTSNGTGAIAYTLVPIAGSLADLGLTHSNGIVSGATSGDGQASFRIEATDTQGAKGESAIVTITVHRPGLAYTAIGPIVEGSTFASNIPVTNIPNATFALVQPIVGITLDPATGVLSGEIGDIADTSSLDIRVRATNGIFSAEAVATLTAIPGAATISLAEGARELNQAFVAYATTTMKPGGSWSLVNAPAGVSINEQSGEISGSFAAAGSYSFAAGYTAPNGARAVSLPATLEVVPSLMTVSANPGSQTVFVGESVGIIATAANAAGAVTYDLEPVSGDITALGLTFSNGSVTGQSTLPGSATFHITAVDSEGKRGRTGLVTVTITGPTLSYPVSPRIIEGSAFLSEPPTTSVSNPTFELISGPPGATIDPTTGVISGSAGDVGATTGLTFEVRASNGRLSATGQASIQIDAAEASLFLSSPMALQGSTITGQASSTMVAQGTWTLVGAPAGITIHPVTGIVTGSIAGLGTYSFSARKTAVNGASATSKPATVSVTESVMTVSATPSSQTVFIGGQISITASASGAVGAVTYELIPVEGTIEALGLAYANGMISGTTTQVGQAVVRIAAVDSIGRRAETAGIVITVTGPTLTYVSPPPVIEGSSFTFAAPTTELQNPTFSFVGEVNGATINPTTGVISGSVGEISQTQILQFEVRATVGNLSATAPAAVIALAASATLTPPQQKIIAGGSIAAQATTTMIAAGTWSLIDAPPGVSINPATGAISGVVQNVGSYAFAARFTASNGAIAETMAVSALVVPAEMAVSTSPGSVNVLIGSPVTITSSSVNAVGPVIYTLVPESGTLSSLGLSFMNGTISGSTTALGVATFKIVGTDSLGDSAQTGTITVQVVNGTLSYEAISGKFEGDSFTSSAPTTNLPNPSFALQPGAPSWVTIDPVTGVLAGTVPNIVGSETFSATVIASGGLGSATYTVAIPAIAGAVTLTQIPDQSVRGVAITAQASTNLPNVTWSLVNAPSWLTINPSTGEITGTTSVGGINSMVARATNGDAFADSAPITMVIVGPIIAINDISTTPLLGTTVDGDATTNIPQATFAMQNAPPWLSIDSQTGRISGTVSSLEAAPNIIVTATNGTVTAVSTPFTILPGQNTNLTVAGTPPTGYIGQPYSFTPTIENAAGPVSVSLESGTVPDGLILNEATGGLSGTPTGAATTSIMLRFADSNGPRLVSYTITINDIVIGFQNLQTIVRSDSPYTGAVSANLPGGTFTLVTGPSGLTVSPSGELGGAAPTIATTNSQTLTIRYNIGGQVREISSAISLRPALAISLTGQSLFSHHGSATSFTPSLTGDPVFPVTWVASTPFTNGYTLNPSTGNVSGFNHSISSQTRTLIVTDSAGYSASVSVTFGAVGSLAVNGGPSGSVAPQIGNSYTSPVVSVTNALSAVTWSVVSRSTLAPVNIAATCPGLTFSNGIISGTPSSSCSIGSSSSPVALRVTTAESSAFGADFWISVVENVTPQTLTFTSGSGVFQLPAYNKIKITVIAGGGGGGVGTTNIAESQGTAQQGGNSGVTRADTNHMLIAGGGAAGQRTSNVFVGASVTSSGIASNSFTGGTGSFTQSNASGPGVYTFSANNNPTTHSFGGASLAGGSSATTSVLAPSGGAGPFTQSAQVAGTGPGAGGAGRCSTGSGTSSPRVGVRCGSGGGSGSRQVYEWNRTDAGAPQPGVNFNWYVGAGGAGGLINGGNQGGNGARGMVQFEIQ